MRTAQEIVEAMVLEAIEDTPGITYADLIPRCSGNGDTDRRIDRALQKLRKRGEISYARKTGWQLTE